MFIRSKSLILFVFILFSLCVEANNGFVRTRGTSFYRGTNSQPCYFTGVNFRYGAMLGMPENPDNQKILCAELDSLCAIGVNSLRIVVQDTNLKYHVTPKSPYEVDSAGQVDESLLKGLDFLLVEMGKRNMLAIICLADYTSLTNESEVPSLNSDSRTTVPDYMERQRDSFFEKYDRHIRSIVGRVNHISGTEYRNDATIMAWELVNGLSLDNITNQQMFVKWVESTASSVKALDANHLVTLGTEGFGSKKENESLYTLIHNNRNIDYMTLCILPVEWKWTSRDRLFDALPNVFQKSKNYLQSHDRIAYKVDKPYLIDKFMYPRDNNFEDRNSSTVARDAFFSFIFSELNDSKENCNPLSGCIFSQWRGSVSFQMYLEKIKSKFNEQKDEDGEYSIFNTDISTLKFMNNGN